jgi:hypothetical protein
MNRGRGQTDIVHVVPTVPLEPGLYTLRIANPGARQARIGVTWDGADQRRYSADELRRPATRATATARATQWLARRPRPPAIRTMPV